MKQTLIKELSTLITLFLIGFILRIPYYVSYPVFRLDELFENIWSYLVIREGLIPLTNTALFIGAFYNYLAALSYLLCPSIYSFRLLVVLIGSSTIPLLYLFVYRVTGSRFQGLFASILLASMPPHILVASHVAWSASLSPFFYLLALYLLYRSYRYGGWRNILLAGIATGVSIQCHPSLIASYIGIFIASIYYLGFSHIKKKLVLNNIFHYILGFTIGYLNMIIYNILYPLNSLSFIFYARWTGVSHGLTLVEYIRRIGFLYIEYYTMMPTGIPIITLPYHLHQPFFYIHFIIFTSLFLIAFKYSRGGRALGLYLFITMIFLALGTRGTMEFNPFGFAWGPHYLQPLTPITAFMLTIGFKHLYQRISRQDVRIIYRLVKNSLILLIIFTIMVWPLLNLYGIYWFMDTNNYTNNLFIETTYYLRNNYPDTPILVIYKTPFKDPVLYMFNLICIVEDLDIYPKINKDVVITFREIAIGKLGRDYGKNYVREIYIESIKKYVYEVYRKGEGILVMTPDTDPYDVLKHLYLGNYRIVNEKTIYAGEKELYKIVFIKAR